MSTHQAFTITVDDQNDNAPVVTTAAAQSVNENSAFSAALTSTDVDTVGTNPATFSITGGADAALFSIVGGNLTMTAKDFEHPADADHNNTYVVEVAASDGANTTPKTITVTVNDQNDNAPVVTTDAAQSVNENSAFSAALTSTDVDTVGTNPATFSITGGADAALFSIVGGNLTMTAKDFEHPADADHNNTYVVEVTANDGANTTPKTITVTVLNDPSDDNHAPGNISFVPTATGNSTTPLGHFAATDPDSGDTVTFFLKDIGGNIVSSIGGVTIDPSSGDLTTGQNISQVINVVAKDNHGTFSNSLAFKIVVGDSGDATVMTSDLASTNNIVAGLGGTDTLNGSVGTDYLFGGSQDDTLIGKGGADWATGGGGHDQFAYLAAGDSTHAAFDTILDFTLSGGNSDVIDFTNIAGLPTIDSSHTTAVQGLLANASIQVQAGHVAWFQDTANNQTIVYVNTSGGAENQGATNMEIHLVGIQNLNADDFHHV